MFVLHIVLTVYQYLGLWVVCVLWMPKRDVLRKYQSQQPLLPDGPGLELGIVSKRAKLEW